MSAGTFTSYNKKRPGVYINIKAASKPGNALGDRGIVAMPFCPGWGPSKQFIELFSTDFFSGRYTKLLGFAPDAAALQPVREALKYAYKLLVWIPDLGTAATASVGGVSVTAKYKGSFGNRLKVAVEASGPDKAVVTYLDANEVDRQVVSAISALKENDYAAFSGSSALSVAAAVSLNGGADGSVTAAAYTDFFTGLEIQEFQVLAMPTANASLINAAKTTVRKLRDELGKKVQAVLYNDNTADYEGIIAVKQGYTDAFETVTGESFAATVAGMTAAAGAGESNTYRVIKGAKTITGEMNDTEITQAIGQGWFVLSKRADGAIVAEQDINTLVTYDADRSAILSKNRTIRTLDELANTVSLQYQMAYIGKIGNDETGRNLFKGEVIGVMDALSKRGAITGFDSENDVTVAQGPDSDSVILTLAVQTVDAMEKLYMTVRFA